MRVKSMIGAAGLIFAVGCATPSAPGENLEADVDGKADGTRTGTPQQRFDGLVALLNAGPQSYDIPDRARQSELTFGEGVSVDVTVIDNTEGIAPTASAAVARLVNDFAGDARGGVANLVEADTPFTIQYAGASDYFLKELIDRTARAQVSAALADATQTFRFSAYNDGAELLGTEYFVFGFEDIGKSIVFEMSYSEVY
jgi:hypothetical protein